MSNDQRIALRLPQKLRAAIEKERKRMAQKSGENVTMSMTIRALIEKALGWRTHG